MKQIFAILKETFREEIRRKTLLLLMVFPPICIFISTIFVNFTPGAEKEFVMDVSLSVLSLFLMLLTAFIGSDLLSKEETQGTIYFYHSNPVSWLNFIFGKFMGGCLFVCLAVFLTGFFTYVLVIIKFNTWEHNLIKAVVLEFGQIMILFAFATLGAVFLSKITNLLSIMLVYMVGHLTDYFDYFNEHLEESSHTSIFPYLMKLIPDFSRFEARDLIVIGYPVEASKLAHGFLYALIFTLPILFLSFLFARRRFVQ
jgi:ABC-type transport system involved in multi-copper enzyme maturation permease subunit